MWPDRVLNQGPMTYESGALSTALCGPACIFMLHLYTLPVRVNNITILLMAVNEADTAVNCLSRQPLLAFMLKKGLGRLLRQGNWYLPPPSPPPPWF